MRKLFTELHRLMCQGDDAVLVTVIAGSGSFPSGLGSGMLVDKSGRVAGTIGGGAVEYRALGLAAEALQHRLSHGKAFTLRRNEVEDLGMICGGDVKVYFQFIPAGSAFAAFSQQVAACFDKDEDAWVFTDITDENAWQMALYTRGGGLCIAGGTQEGPLAALGAEDIERLLGVGPVQMEVGGRLIFSEHIVHAGRAVLFGGGHLSQELVPLLAHIGFRCVVFEDRADFARPELFPGVSEVILGDFADIGAHIRLTENDYIVIMTRGHAGDYEVQRQVLAKPSAYVGVIGSRSKIASVSQRLREDGIAQEMIDFVHTPIGVSIGAKSPAEIAISIAAELIGVRAERMRPR